MSPHHGRSGPIPVYRTPQDDWGPVDQALRDAALALGYPWTDDLNAPDAEGVTTYAINSRDGKRVSSNDGYLEPARSRPNLEIKGGMLADRVLLDQGKATGIAAIGPEGPVRFDLAPGGELLLAAGAIHSPPILMRSGIGPAAHLKGHGIDVVRDLPVGDGMFDHPFVRLELKLKDELKPKGINDRHTNCCVKYSSNLPGGTFADMIFFAMNHGGVGVAQDMAQFGEAGIHCALFEAHSRGTVRLASADPRDQPVVDLNMLDDERDLARLRDGARRLMAIGQHDAVTEPLPRGQPRQYRPARSRTWPTHPMAKLDEWILTDCSDAQHGAGSCRMGAFDFDDGRSVVDPALPGARHRRASRHRRLGHAGRLQGQHQLHHHHDRRDDGRAAAAGQSRKPLSAAMLSATREQSILQALQRDGRVAVGEIAGRLGVSAETIRRDLASLEAAGRLRRVHGGAVLFQPDKEQPIVVRSRIKSREKAKLAGIAREMVEDGMSIFIDTGSTPHGLRPHAHRCASAHGHDQLARHRRSAGPGARPARSRRRPAGCAPTTTRWSAATPWRSSAASSSTPSSWASPPATCVMAGWTMPTRNRSCAGS